MAQYRWYADDLANDVNPIGNGFTLVGTASSTSRIVTATGGTPIGTKAWELIHDSATLIRWRATLDAAGTSADSDVILLFRYFDADNNYQSGVQAVHQYVASPSQYYILGLRNETFRYQAQKQVNGGAITTISGDAHEEDYRVDWYWFRGQKTGTTLRFKVWQYDPIVEEPAAWTRTYTDADISTAGATGFGAYINSSVDSTEIAYVSVGTGTDLALYPETATLGITITGIKEPNEADTLVASVTTARVKVWYGSDDTGAEDELHVNQTITNGALEVELTDGTVDAAAIVEVMWTVGTERKLFITDTTVVDIGSGA
jgi:hypothetical protein